MLKRLIVQFSAIIGIGVIASALGSSPENAQQIFYFGVSGLVLINQFLKDK